MAVFEILTSSGFMLLSCHGFKHDKKWLSAGLPGRLCGILSATQDCTRRDRLQSAFNLFEQRPKGRIVVNAALDQIKGMDHCRMVAAELLADAGKGITGELAAKIHRNLPAEGHMLCAFFRFEIGQMNMERIRDGPLKSFDAGFACISR